MRAASVIHAQKPRSEPNQTECDVVRIRVFCYFRLFLFNLHCYTLNVSDKGDTFQYALLFKDITNCFYKFPFSPVTP